MIDKSRIDIYDYVEGLIVTNVTENVYPMYEPQELTEDDAENGFVVVSIGDYNDDSEFSGEAMAWARVYIQAFVPAMSRGRLDKTKYRYFEDSINTMISTASEIDNEGTYWIQEGSVLSMDGVEESSTNGSFFVFVKSFIVEVGYTEN